MSFFAELKRRNVFRVGIAYVVGAWLLLQFTEVLSELLSLPATIGPVVVAVVAIGLPIVLFFAWAYELTPEGVKRESEVDRSQSITPQTGRKLNNAIVVLLALAVAYLLFDKFAGEEESEPSSQEISTSDTASEDETSALTPNRLSIAVLPFDNRSNREEDQFFTDGIHDDLLTTIAKIGSMKVISRTSVMEYRGTTKKIPEIAAELGVANVLEGGIQRSGNQVRINVQLIDARTDEHLWAEIYDRDLTAENLFAIQSEISNAIAGALKATLTPEERQRINTMPTQNLESYDAYLRGKQLMATRRTADLEASRHAFLKAVELDPEFALAWVGVADSHDLLTNYRDDLSDDEFIAVREHAIQRALAIDPSLGEAYASLGALNDDLDRGEESEVAYRRAIELSPNYATAYQWYAVNIQDPLRHRERLQLVLKALELDPRSRIINMSVAAEYRRQGLFSQAERQYEKTIELFPEFPNGFHGLADHHMWDTGQLAKAMELLRELEARDPGNSDTLRHQGEIYIEIGDLDAVRAIQDKISAIYPNVLWLGVLDMYRGLKTGSPGAVREALAWTLPRLGDARDMKNVMGGVFLSLGDTERARELYLQTNPGWLDPAQWDDLIKSNARSGCVFSWILLHGGEEEVGGALLDRATRFHEQELPTVIEHADRYMPELCYLTAGEIDKALDSLEEQLAHGHFWQWDMIHSMPLYDSIRLEPRYLELMEERQRKITEQRQLIEQMDEGMGP